MAVYRFFSILAESFAKPNKPNDMKKLIFGLALVAAMSCSATDSVTKTTTNPKEEFRGAWIHTVSQGQYAKMSTDECKA